MTAVAKRRLYYKDEKLARNALLQRRDAQKLRAGVRHQPNAFAKPLDCRISLPEM